MKNIPSVWQVLRFLFLRGSIWNVWFSERRLTLCILVFRPFSFLTLLETQKHACLLSYKHSKEGCEGEGVQASFLPAQSFSFSPFQFSFDFSLPIRLQSIQRRCKPTFSETQEQAEFALNHIFLEFAWRRQKNTHRPRRQCLDSNQHFQQAADWIPAPFLSSSFELLDIYFAFDLSDDGTASTLSLITSHSDTKSGFSSTFCIRQSRSKHDETSREQHRLSLGRRHSSAWTSHTLDMPMQI